MQIKTHLPFGLLSLFLLLILMGASCKKEELSPLEQLPAATQVGRNTFGCLVNGKVHVPTGQLGFGVPPYECYYIYLPPKDGRGGGFHFKVSATDAKKDNLPTIRIFTDSLALREGAEYKLTVPHILGTAHALYYKDASQQSLANYIISPPLTGKLLITKLDEQKRIVAGTFWFDAVNAVGEKVEVREGRFDMKF